MNRPVDVVAEFCPVGRGGDEDGVLAAQVLSGGVGHSGVGIQQVVVGVEHFADGGETGGVVHGIGAEVLPHAAERLGVGHDQTSVAGFVVRPVKVVAHDVDFPVAHVEVHGLVAEGRTVDRPVDILFDGAVGRKVGNRTVLRHAGPLIEQDDTVGVGIPLLVGGRGSAAVVVRVGRAAVEQGRCAEHRTP